MKRLITTLILVLAFALGGLPVGRAVVKAPTVSGTGFGELRFTEHLAAMSLEELRAFVERKSTRYSYIHIGGDVGFKLPGKRQRIRRVIRHAPRPVLLTENIVKPVRSGQLRLTGGPKSGFARLNLGKFTFENMPPLPPAGDFTGGGSGGTVDGAAIEALIGPPPLPPPQGAVSYATQVTTNLSTGLAGYWRHTETSGTSVADSAPGNHPCTLTGTVALNQTSLVTDDANPAGLYGGGVCTTAAYATTTTGMTLSVVAKFNSFPTLSDSGNASLVSIGAQSSTVGFHNLKVINTGDVRYAYTTGSAVVNRSSGVTLALGKTYHLVVTHDFVAGIIKLFVNGVLRDSNGAATVEGALNATVRISGSFQTGVVLDDVAPWIDRVLTDDEVKLLFRSSRAVDTAQVIHYAATTGVETAKASLAEPLTLIAAIQSGFARGGERIEIRGGTYTGGHYVYLRGDSSSARITISNYEGEHVKILSKATTPYANALNVDPTAKHVTIQGHRKSGMQTIEFANEDTDRETDVAGSGAPDVGGRGDFNGLYMAGDDVNLINVVIHDMANSITSFQEHNQGEMYGMIMYNSGWHGPDRAHGHGFYSQNDSGALKSFRNYISMNQYITGGKAYGESSTAYANDYLFEDGITLGSGWPEAVLQLERGDYGDVSLAGTSVSADSTNLTSSGAFSAGNAGMWVRIPGAGMLGRNFYGHIKTYNNANSVTLDQPAYTTVSNVTTRGVLLDPDSENTFFAGLMVGVAVNPSSNITISRMVSNDLFWIGYTASSNTDVSLTNSYFGRLKLNKWMSLINTGNTQFSVNNGTAAGDNQPVIVRMTTTGLPVNTIDNNDYFTLGGTGNEFYYNAATSGLVGWQLLGFDATGSHTTTRPTTNAVFVKPNEYEPGSANIAIFNWEGLTSVTVNISTAGLVNGQAYEIRNAQALFTDVVVSTTYNSASPTVAVPMTSTAFTKPLGYTYGLETTLPAYGVFVLLPGAPPAGPDPPSGLSAAWAFSSQGAVANITLSWTDASDDETGFIVYKSSDGISYSVVTTTAANATSYTVLGTGLDATSLWRFKVSSVNALGESVPAGPVSEKATPLSCYKVPCTR